jgi:hypothetical protein
MYQPESSSTDEQDEMRSLGVSVKPEGDAVIGGDVVGRDKITIINQTTGTSQERRLRLTVHLAAFTRTGVLCYFINATNLSGREIEITHIWFDCDPQIPALQPDRILPKQLKPDESWETWVEASRLPPHCDDPYTLARARLSTGQVFQSQKNDNVPDQGFIPGGPIGGETSGEM